MPKKSGRGTFEERLIRSMEQALAIHQGKMKPAWVHSVPLAANVATVAVPPLPNRSEIARIRRRLGLSQQVFAAALNVSLGTVRSWEQGLREPDGPSVRLLEIAERNPEAILRNVIGPAQPKRSRGRKREKV